MSHSPTGQINIMVPFMTGWMLFTLSSPLKLQSGWAHLDAGPKFRLQACGTSLKSSFGIPSHLDEMDVGQGFQEESLFVEKVSSSPPVFVLRGLLSPAECATLMNSVSNFEPAKTLSSSSSDDDLYRKRCSVAWLSNEEQSLSRTICNKCHSILLPNQIFDIERGVESLQVVRYEHQGEYILHHDSNERILTVLYYLNGIGETWFPLADCHKGDDPRNRHEALELCKDNDPTRSGVLVSCEGRGTRVQQGDAVAFYNYFSDRRVNWRTIHTGMPATSTKWIANHWYHHFPFSFP